MIILHRSTPELIDGEYTFERLWSIVECLTVWIRQGSGPQPESDNRRMEMYLTLAAKLLDNERLTAIYKSSKETGISLTSKEYHRYLWGFSKQPEIFDHVAREVWRDMAVAGIELQARHFKEVLKAAGMQGNILTAIKAFRRLEEKYSHV